MRAPEKCKAIPATSLATGRATHAGQISSEVPGKDRHTGPSGWELVVGLSSSHRKIRTVSKPERREGHGLKTIRSAKDEEEKEEEDEERAHTRACKQE